MFRITKLGSKKSSDVTVSPIDNTTSERVTILIPGLPPHSTTYNLFSHAAYVLVEHGSATVGLRLEKLNVFACMSGTTTFCTRSRTSSRSGLE